MRYLIISIVGIAGIALVGALWPDRPAAAAEEVIAKVPAKDLPVLPPTRSEAAKGLKDSELVPLKLELPRVLFDGTPKNLPETTIDPQVSGKTRGAFYVKKGMELLSSQKPIRMSDESPIIGQAGDITDGNKEGTDGNWVELGPGMQWVQVDLRKRAELWAIVLWHYHKDVRVYRDVVVQLSDDPDFIENVTTLFNNDHDNSSGHGLGKDCEYIETNEGKLIDAKGLSARYIRCYSKGNTSDGQNHYIEVEAWGK